ncbi:uncharacterized protein VTP21DRAFT_4259 [Calcarisporiella thermophila]|uniref:uncharacterized protein n=1 Tax=Calcarisporiella thermophila TaxID=911321 RepID=UPI003743C980
MALVKRKPNGEPSQIHIRSRKRKALTNVFKKRRRILEPPERTLSIYRQPFTTLAHFLAYTSEELRKALYSTSRLVSRRRISAAVAVLLVIALVSASRVAGPHNKILEVVRNNLEWYSWWTFLGIASSIGLGSGLHTFVLFLAPHIAEVTFFAYQCGHLNFATRGDSKFRCATYSPSDFTLLQVYQRVQLEVFFWGVGTAIGELPPYFVAKASSLSGNQHESLEQLEAVYKKAPETLTLQDRVMLCVRWVLDRLGFFGILLFASIPNPAFDLAGITCGHFQVPFWTFFGATLLGKAFIKATIQGLAIVVISSADTLAAVLIWLRSVWPWLHDLVEGLVRSQATAFSRGIREGGEASFTKAGLVARIWNGFVLLMFAYFLVSTVESLAQIHARKRKSASYQKG